MGLLWCFFLSGNDKKTFQMFQMIIKELYRTLGQMGGGVCYILGIQELRPYTPKPNAWIKG